MSQPPRSKQPVRPVSTRPTTRPTGSTRTSSTGSGGAPPRRSGERPRYVEQKRDPFPYIMGGIIGAMIVGLMAVIWLLTQQSNNAGPGPVTASTPGVNTGATIMSEQTAPRMPIDEFKSLYDNPASRPYIIDVRAKQAFDEGHIVGAVSFPEAEVDARIAELPKDRLIIAYCQ